MSISIPGNRIREFRVRKNMTQKMLAKRIHCSPQSISGFERGVLPIRLDYCYAICLALDATLNDIFWVPELKNA